MESSLSVEKISPAEESRPEKTPSSSKPVSHKRAGREKQPSGIKATKEKGRVRQGLGDDDDGVDEEDLHKCTLW